MPNPLRLLAPGRLWFVTNRTIDQAFLLLPFPEIERIFEEWLVRASEATGVRVYAYIVMSNHYHLVVDDPDMKLDKFMQLLQSQSSRLINRFHDRWGPFYVRRYTAAPIFGELALEGRIAYCLLNPVAAGLVAKATDWWGATSAHQTLQGKAKIVTIFDRTAWHKAKRPRNKKPFQRKQRLVLAVPEHMAHWTQEERRKHFLGLIKAGEARHKEDRKGRPVLGYVGVMRQDPRTRPPRSDHSKRPLCHVQKKSQYLAYKAEYEAVVADHREASNRYRSGDYDVKFPPGTFRPPIRRVAQVE